MKKKLDDALVSLCEMSKKYGYEMEIKMTGVRVSFVGLYGLRWLDSIPKDDKEKIKDDCNFVRSYVSNIGGGCVIINDMVVKYDAPSWGIIHNTTRTDLSDIFGERKPKK